MLRQAPPGSTNQEPVTHLTPTHGQDRGTPACWCHLSCIQLKKGFLRALMLTAACTTPFALQSEARAVDCITGINNIQSLITANTCTTSAGWGIRYVSHSASLSPLDQLSFTGGGQNLSYQITGFLNNFSPSGSPYNFQFDVISIPAGRYLSQFSTNLSSSVIPLADNSGSSTSVSTAAGSATGNMASSASTPGSKSYADTTTITDSFSVTLNVTNGFTEQFNGSITTLPNTTPPASGVPAPLPLVGAGGAFHFSRRMRRRLSLHS